jgi:hypothetical protein
MKKQFLLFAGMNYYPKGGAYDFKGSFETVELAVKAHDPFYCTISKHKYYDGWANIFDLKEQKIVKQCYQGNWHEGDDEIY